MVYVIAGPSIFIHLQRRKILAGKRLVWFSEHIFDVPSKDYSNLLFIDEMWRPCGKRWREREKYLILGDPEDIVNIYCKSSNVPNTDIRNYTIDLRKFLRHPVVKTSYIQEMEEVHKEKERVKERDLQKRLARLERDQPQPPGKLLQVLWIRMLEIRNRIHPMQKCRSGS